MKALLKIKAGALQLVIFVSVILFLLLSSFILLHYFNQLNQLEFLFEREAQIKNIESFKNTNRKDLSSEFSFIGSEGSIEKSFVNYGCFQLLKSTTSLSKSEVTNFAFVGGKPNTTSLILENHQFGLSISGKTRLEGNLQLPKEGLKAGFVNGKYYYGSNLNYFGTITRSKDLIVEPKNVKRFASFVSSLNTSTEIGYIEQLKPKEIYHNSFSLPTKVYIANRSVHLKHLNLSGNIVLKSSSEIHVYKTSALEDVILIAPKIVVHESTHGIFQALATEQIVLEKSVVLDYPSALVLKDSGKEGGIELLEKVYFSGVLLYLRKKDKDFRSVNVKINEKVNILGDVFCQGGLSIENAKVRGSVCSKYFIHKTLGSTYVNTIFGVHISNLGKYQKFSGLQWGEHYKVMKWLY